MVTVKHLNSHIKVIGYLETIDGMVTSHTPENPPRGIRDIKGLRPYYATVQCVVGPEQLAIEDIEKAKNFLYNDISAAMSGPTTSKGRILIKPYWFHKLMTQLTKG